MELYLNTLRLVIMARENGYNVTFALEDGNIINVEETTTNNTYKQFRFTLSDHLLHEMCNKYLRGLAND